MSFTNPRKKNSRFYWAELGFLALGLFGLNPSLITDILVGAPPAQAAPRPAANSLAGYGGYPSQSPNPYYGNTPYGFQQPLIPAGYSLIYNGNPTAYPPASYPNASVGGAVVNSNELQLMASRIDQLASKLTQWMGNNSGGNANYPDNRNSWGNNGNGQTNFINPYANPQADNFGASNGFYPQGGNGYGNTNLGYTYGTKGNFGSQTVPPANYQSQNPSLITQLPGTATNGSTNTSHYQPAYGAANSSSPSIINGYPSNYATIANQPQMNNNVPYVASNPLNNANYNNAQYPYWTPGASNNNGINVGYGANANSNPNQNVQNPYIPYSNFSNGAGQFVPANPAANNATNPQARFDNFQSTGSIGNGYGVNAPLQTTPYVAAGSTSEQFYRPLNNGNTMGGRSYASPTPAGRY